MKEYGLLIGDKHTVRDFGLMMTSYYMPEPETKIQKIDLPFSSGSIDLTDATGVTPYNDRTGLEFVFLMRDGGAEQFAQRVQELSMYLHGKPMKLIPDHEEGYYYIVRLNVDPKKTNVRTSEIVITGVADPFKYNILASNEPWEWDSFNFVNGVIQDTSDITVSGTKTISVMAGGVPTCPQFYVSLISGSLSVTYKDIEYKFSNGVGNYKFPQITISDTDTDLTFKGNGKVSIIYRGRFL